MSRLLSEVLPPGITGGTVRKGYNSLKGYHREDLEESFERYLPSRNVSEATAGLRALGLEPASKFTI
jgi:hypothetical protein